MANALTSRTSPVANGVVSHPVPAKAQGVHLYAKYTKGDGTSVTSPRPSSTPSLTQAINTRRLTLMAT